MPAPPSARVVLAALAWLLALALLPWWLGLPLLLAMAAMLLVGSERLGALAATLRVALRWGLPGVLFAAQRALGGDAFAWGVALLGALAGYTLIAGLEAWLDRHRRRAPPSPPVPEWPELALGPVGPPVEVIELRAPTWCNGSCDDPRGGIVRAEHARDGQVTWRLSADGTFGALGPDACFSPDGRWFAAHLPRGRGVLLCDRDRAIHWRLRGWDLCGWAAEPWLIRGDGPPQALREVLGDGPAAGVPPR